MLDEIKLNILDKEKLLSICKALDSSHRLDILSLIAKRSLNVTELAKELGRPISSTRLDLKILQSAGLIKIENIYNNIGKNIIAHRTFDKISLDFFNDNDYTLEKVDFKYELPIGSFSRFYDIEEPCGMCSETSNIGQDDDPSIFYSPQRFKAELIWMTSGFLEYYVPMPTNKKNIKSIDISFEVCSEAPLFNNDFKSDISLFINDCKIGDWISPADFGDMRGILNPDFWPNEMTQHGVLTNWHIDEIGSTVNNFPISYTNINNLNLKDNHFLAIKIGVDKNAKHKGGINLFGSKFGNHPQNIIVKIQQ